MKQLKTLAIAATLATMATEAVAIEWNVSVWGKRRAFTEHVERLAELVKEKTKGDLTLNISYGGLSKNRENLDGISIGAFEMAQFCAGYHRDKNPSITVLELPFLGVNTLREEIAVSMAVYNHPATAKDLARWNAKLLMPSPMPQYNLVGSGDQPKSLEEFKGMRIRATGGLGQAFAAIGAVPTSVTATETYNAMESGVVDAIAFAQHAHLAYRILDKGQWWSENLNPGTVNCPIVVNADAFDALSESNQKAITESVDEALDHYVTQYDKVLASWEKKLKEKNIKKVQFPAEQIDEFKKLAAGPVRTQWLEKMTKQGLPAQELYDLTQKTLQEFRSK